MTRKHPKSAVRLNALSPIEQRLGPIEYRNPAELQFYAANPRKHPEKQIVKLMASVSEFGFVAPALINEQGLIIAGEARVEAARRLGLAAVSVIVASHFSAAQVRAYRLADNRLAELSSWDQEALAIELAAIIVRRQNIWLNSWLRLAECGPRLGVDVRRRACGAASADVRWSVA